VVTESQTQSALFNLKSIKLSAAEQDFIKEYRRLEEIEREKGIKFFECIGDPPHNDEFVSDTLNLRTSLIDTRNNEMRHRDITRFT
jgi:hypothetical protein